MKKLLLVLVFTSQLIGAIAKADEPHIVPALNCPTGQICCPVALACSFLNGCGDTGLWRIEGGYEIKKFDGIKVFNLSKIIGNVNSYQGSMYCEYSADEKDPAQTVMLIYGAHNASLNGNKWEYTFMKLQSHCDTNNPTDCTFAGDYCPNCG